jgi:HEAT repeat protein
VLLRVVVAAALLAASAGSAPAHGSAYRGPTGEVPPDLYRPDDPPPPETGGSWPTPPEGSPEPAAVVAHRPARSRTTYDSWRFWWAHNGDAVLESARPPRGPPIPAAVHERILAALRPVAKDPRLPFEIQAAAVLALGRMGRSEEVPWLVEAARNAKGEYHKGVEEACVLALGALPEPQQGVRPLLREIAADREAKYRTRCFAMLALGLRGHEGAAADPETVALLRSLVLEPGSGPRHIGSSALLSLGLLGDPAAIPDLPRWLRDGRAGEQSLDDFERSYAAAALGRFGDRGEKVREIREVLLVLRNRACTHPRITRYASLIALGRLTPLGSEEDRRLCLALLGETLDRPGAYAADAQARGFAAISLGRIASHPAVPRAESERCVAMLLHALGGGGDGAPSFAALALGLAARSLPEEARSPLAKSIRERLSGIRGGVEERGAFLLALGMLGDRGSAPVLRGILGDREEEPALRGAAAEALGLLGDGASMDAVRKALEQRETRHLHMHAALAAGLLRDAESVPLLLDALRNPKSPSVVLGSVARSLGWIGDAAAVEPLLAVLADGNDEYPDLTRAVAVVALGRIAAPDGPFLPERLGEDFNHRAWYDALGEVLTLR